MGKVVAVSKKPVMKKPPKSAGDGKVAKRAVSNKATSKTKKPVAKKPAAKKKKSKKAASDDEGSEAGGEEEAQPDVVADDEGDADAVMRPVRDDPDEAPDNDKKTPEQKARDAVKRANKKARARGYRQVAEKGGYTADYATSDQSRDVSSNIITVNEARRAAAWRPMIEGKVAFDNTVEYEERLEIANEPLIPRSGEVLRASLEVFMRRLVADSLQSAFDVGSKKLKPEHVMPHTRKLQRHLKYTFDAPKGVVRYAQQEKDGERLRIPTSDQEEIANVDREAVEEQKAMWKAQGMKNDKRKADREARVAEAKAKKAARAA